jgi:hypothetical protein
MNAGESPTEGRASRCQQRYESVRIVSILTHMMVVRRDTCTSIASTGAPNFG